MTPLAEELIARAECAYFVAARKLMDQPDQPLRAGSGLEEVEGKKYVVLRNVNGVLAVYRVRPDGILKRLVRWPPEIGEI